MNASKTIAILAATLITAAGMYGIAAYSNAAASAQGAPHASLGAAITTLPAITVRPTPAQLREIRGARVPAVGSSAAAGPSDARMPFYSFASESAGA